MQDRKCPRLFVLKENHVAMLRCLRSLGGTMVDHHDICRRATNKFNISLLNGARYLSELQEQGYVRSVQRDDPEDGRRIIRDYTMNASGWEYLEGIES